MLLFNVWNMLKQLTDNYTINDTNNIIETIIEQLCNEKVCLLQTDTVFGLICRGDSDVATKKIEDIKHRDHKAFGYFMKDLKMAEKYVVIDNDKKRQYFQSIFPGYFTLIFEATDFAIKTMPKNAFGINKNGKKTLGIRIPKNDFCLQVLNDERITFPLLATSANISKQATPIRYEDVDEEIIKAVDYIYYDNNVNLAGKSSTIIDLSCDDGYTIIREGSGVVDDDVLDGLFK